MNHYKINPTPWNENLNAKPGMVVTYQNGYYSNKNGKNSIPTNNSDWTYIGEVDKKGSLASRRAENLDSEDVLAWQEKLDCLTKQEYTNVNGLILPEKILPLSYQKKLSSFDESILIEPDGNIENNVSLFTEYFNTQNCILGFTPIQILGVYKNGLKLKPSEYTIILPKTISINTYIDEDIEVQYTHLKNILI